MTTHSDPAPGAGQSDLFGNPTPDAPETAPPVSRVESNDIDLMHTVAANAVSCGYVLVGPNDRVYARTNERDDVARVPRYEEDAVHQLLRRRWLTTGGGQDVVCGALSLSATAVLVPRPPAPGCSGGTACNAHRRGPQPAPPAPGHRSSRCAWPATAPGASRTPG